MAVQIPQEGQEINIQQLSRAQFDPVQFLNDTLPSLALTSQPAPSKQSRTAALQSTSAEVQTLLSKLNTHSIKSASELNSLTDEILRSGNRLAYEVEVLRGDVNSLYELLTESLKDDISRFVTEEAQKGPAINENSKILEDAAVADDNRSTTTKDPEFIQQLRILGNVKIKLEAVIHVFGEALKWPVAPSEVSMATSLISVSAPELGVVDSAEDEKAREYTRQLRNDVTATLDSEGGGVAGLDAASKRVDDLRALSQVWKGTAEEKPRNRVVDSLIRVVEDRRRLLNARAATQRANTDSPGMKPSSISGRAGRIVEGSTNTAAGLFRNLQKLRDEIYQD